MDENQDLAKQYQDILDRYSRELATSAPTTPENTPQEPQPAITAPEPVIAITQSESALPPTTSTFSSPVAPTPTPGKSNLFKYLFFVSLIIFLGVLGAIIYTLSKSGNATTISNPIPTSTSENIDATPSVSLDKMCSVNDKQYKIGESFISDDSCNTCSCGADLTIVCTQKACDATPSIKLVPTLKITSTPKATPTTDILGTWKKYSQPSLGFELMYPSTMTKTGESNDQYNKYVSLANSKTNVSVVVKSAPGVDMTKYFYMDNPIDSTATVLAGMANIYKLPKGYCDGPSCSKPAIVYVLKSGDNLFQIIFTGDTLLSTEEQQILDTFKFIQ